MKRDEQFQLIYNDTYDDLLKYLVYRCSNYDDANDIAQETYADLYRQLGQREIDDARAYAMGIARNKLKRYYGEQRLERERMSPCSIDDPAVAALISDGFDLAGSVQRKITREEIWEYLHRKDTLTAEIFEQYYRGGWTIRQIAVRLRVGESTVKNRLYRTLKELHKIYNNERTSGMKQQKNGAKWVVGAAALLVLVGGVALGLLRLNYNDAAQEGDLAKSANRVVINWADSAPDELLIDADVRLEENTEIPEWSLSLALPAGLPLAERYSLYAKEPCARWKDCVNKPYNILHDRVLIYRAGEGAERMVRIAYSPEYQPLRDYLLSDETEISEINGAAVTIQGYQDMLVATFRSGGINYDVETAGLSVEELVGLVESMVAASTTVPE